MELRAFFDRALRASFHDLALGNDPASPYLADLLTRFARTENLYPRGVTLPRLQTVVDMLLETATVWEDPQHFRPEHEVTVSRHIGDFTGWKDHDAYQGAFARLLRDLRASEGAK